MMKKAVWFFVLLSWGVAAACIWDTDTVETELKGVPDRRVLISNRWYRHSLDYYRERLERLGPKVDKTLDDFDDLTVAYERFGQFGKALAALEEKRALLERSPHKEHLYRYHANRGTVLAHSGRYQESLRELEKALEINPEAHFGREEFQLLLIRYVIAAKQNPELWKNHNFLSFAGHPEDSEEAFQGVAGMLRFGGREGAELYRALGDISLAQEHRNVAWYFYRMAVLKKHPASEQLEATLDEFESYWKESRVKRYPDREHFEKVYLNSTQWLTAFQAAEKKALEDGRDCSDDLVLQELLDKAEEQVPPLALAAFQPDERLPQERPLVVKGDDSEFRAHQYGSLMVLGGSVVLMVILVTFPELRSRRRARLKEAQRLDVL